MKIRNYKLKYTKFPKHGHVYFFTANNIINKQDHLVMGAGNAKAMKDMIPTAPKKFGQLVKSKPHKPVHLVEQFKGYIGSFRTKNHWRNPSTLSIVTESIESLLEMATAYEDYTFHLPCPAINNGGMSKEVILPLLECLPDNVYIYLEN